MRRIVIAVMTAAFALAVATGPASAAPVEHSNGTHHGDPVEHSN